MKRWLAWILAGTILFSAWTLAAHAEDYSFAFEVNSQGNATITQLYGSGQRVVVPQTIQGYPVTAIGYQAFLGRGVTQVVLPETITVIDRGAFSACTNLESINLPAGLTHIGEFAFDGCYSLTGHLVIPPKIQEISDGAFRYCESLSGVTLPPELKTISSEAFNGCSGILQLEFPQSVQEIGPYAFAYCNSLTRLTLPEGLTELADGLVKGCSSLTELSIPNSVVTVGDYALALLDSMKELQLPSGITKIGAYGFAGSYRLSTVHLPEALQELGDGAFETCTGLLTQHLPAKVCRLGENIFSECCYLSEITVDPNNSYFTAQDGVLFSKDMTRLIYYPVYKEAAEYVIPQGVKIIHEGAFSQGSFAKNTTLKTITVPASVEEGAFFFHSVADIRVDAQNPVYASQDGVLFSKDMTWLIQYPGGSDRTQYQVPRQVKVIGEEAFSACYRIVQVLFPEGLTDIRAYAFANTNLTAVHLPASMQRVGPYAFLYSGITQLQVDGGIIESHAFNDCKNLTQAVITADSIGPQAFYGCSALEHLELKEGLTSIDTQAFFGCRKLKNISLPATLKSLGKYVFDYTAYWEAEENWQDGVCYLGETLLRAKTTLQGRCVIKPGTKTIADFAFENCVNLQEVVLPSSLQTIGDSAFMECNNLRAVHLPASVQSIGVFAFIGEQLQAITVDEQNPYFCHLDGVLFNKEKTVLLQFPCHKAVTQYNIPHGVQTIARGAFAYRLSQDPLEVTFSPSVTTLEPGAFLWNDGIQKIELGSHITVVGARAFEQCNSLTTLFIDAKTVMDGAFLACRNLQTVTVGPHLEELGEDAFAVCRELKQLYLPQTVTLLHPHAVGTYGQNDKNRIEVIEGFTLYGQADSAAMLYAQQHNLPFVVGEIPQPEEIGYGDVNHDTRVDAEDALWVLQAAVHKRTLTQEEWVRGDVDLNGQLNAADALLILLYGVKRIPDLPVPA